MELTTVVSLCDEFIERVVGGVGLVSFSVVGSYGKNRQNDQSDIDILMIVENQFDEGVIETCFRKFYYDLHSFFNIIPDNNYPGELVSLGRLLKSQQKCLSSAPEPIISDAEVFDGLVWSSMIYSRHIPVRSDFEMLESLYEHSRNVLDHYRVVLAPDIYINDFVDNIKFYIRSL